MSVQTYNSSVRALNLHRIATILAFAGIFIAGTLSLKYIFDIDPPCGAGGGCEVVGLSPQAYWFKIPVAYFGLGAYIALALIASMRLLSGIGAPPLLSTAALGISGVGAVLSMFLQYQSLTVIKEVCSLCLASAIIMSVLFLVNAALHTATPERTAVGKKDTLMIPALGLAAALGIGIMAMYSRTEAKGTVEGFDETRPLPPFSEFVPTDSLKLGPDDAPIKLVEFSDLICPSCRRAYPDIKRLVEASNGKIQLIYRHFPVYTLKGHEMAISAAFAAEFASEKGKGWEFVEAIQKVPKDEMTSLDPILKTLKDIGLKPEEAKARMTQEDPAYKRVSRDLEFAIAGGLNETPTFVVLTEGEAPMISKRAALFDLLKTPPYSDILGADVP
jgi:protein-disulfide isomerase